MADLLTLGAVVVGVAVRLFPLWRGSDSATDIGALELVEGGLGTVLNGNRAQNLLDPIEKTVATRVAGIMESEFRSVPSNEREAAVLAVRTSLESCTLPELFAADLNAQRLFAAVVAANPRATSHLSEGATQLYRSIVADCCVVVVALAHRAAGFDVGVFGAMLDRLSGAQRSLDEMLALVNLLLTSIPPPAPSEQKDFESTYRTAVASQLDRLVMVGLPDGAQVYGLTAAYVALDIDTAAVADRIRESNPADDQTVLDGSRSLTVEEALAVTTRLLLRGEAGYGKTTVLQWIAVRCARGDMPPALAEWKGLVPFYIKLRSWTDGRLPKPGEFLDDVGQVVVGEMPPGWVNAVLGEGRAVVLVDGVDELPDDMREPTRSWLSGLIDMYPYNRYIVSSRPSAAKEDWLAVHNFDVARIEPMRPDAIRALVTGWHDAYALLTDDPIERDRVRTSQELVLSAINGNRHLRQLAASPLVAALLCALQMSRDDLPKSRLELYRIAIEVLMAQRPSRLGPAVIEPEEARDLLRYLAYWMIDIGTSYATKSEFRAKLTSRLRQHPKISALPEVVLSDLLNRSGLIREPSRGRIDFVHRTFQEFLAAEGAIDAEDGAVLVSNGHDDQWQQVIIMAAGRASQGQRERIIAGLLDRAMEEEAVRPALNALAIACLETSGPIDDELRLRVNAVAATLLPPRTPTEGETLAAIGNLALDLIENHPIKDSRTAAAVVRMASRIGGAEANRVMARCAQVRPLSQAVRTELLSAWSLSPAPERFAAEVMALTKPRGLILDDPGLVVGLHHVTMKTLRVQFARGYGSLSYVKGCTGLQDLQVFRDSVLTNLSGLENHPALEAVTLVDTGVVDLAPLTTVPRLGSLQIRTALVSDLRTLAQLPSLTTALLTGGGGGIGWEELFAPTAKIRRLNLVDNSELSDLASCAVSQLDSLQDLAIRNAPALHRLTGLEKWAECLRILSLQSLPLVDASPIAALTRLESLNLLSTHIRDVSMVRCLPALSTLHLGGRTPVPLPSLSPLAGHPSLTNLHLHGVTPVDLRPLAGQAGLTVHIYGQRGRPVTGRDILGAGSRLRYPALGVR